MNELYNLELSDNTIKGMCELNPEVMDLTEEEIIKKEDLLENLGADRQEIINIIGSNSLYLSRTDEEINNLVVCLKKYGFTNLNILFDSNPYILNLDPFEIDNYINDRVQKGEELSDIVDDLDSNPYLFNEF